jgi:hypothetical protein
LQVPVGFRETHLMNDQLPRKFCSICTMPNEPEAIVCVHCGARFDRESAFSGPTQRMDEVLLESELQEQVMSKLTPPPEGLAVYLLDKAVPVATMLEKEFLLGRVAEEITEPLVDLTDLDGLDLGVSRRHAMIRASWNGYVLIDLNSSNGTWLNGHRIVPNTPNDLPNGAVIQLGRLKLVVSYLHPPGG